MTKRHKSRNAELNKIRRKNSIKPQALKKLAKPTRPAEPEASGPLIGMNGAVPAAKAAAPRTQALSIWDERTQLAIPETALRLVKGSNRTDLFNELARAGGLTLRTETLSPPEGTRKITVDAAHADRLRGYHRYLNVLLGSIEMPLNLRIPGMSLLFELEDLISGMESKRLQPVKDNPERPIGDPARDWAARAYIVLGAEHSYRANGRKSYPKAFLAVLEKIDEVLSKHGIHVWQAIPGKKSKGRQEDNRGRPELSERAIKLDRLMKRCERHRQDFDVALSSIPRAARDLYNSGMAHIDALEKAGRITGEINKEYVDLATLLILDSWDRDDAERDDKSLGR